jgi:hypothetical protein
VAFFVIHAGSTGDRALRGQDGSVGNGVGEEQEKRVLGFLDEALGPGGVEFRVVVFSGVESVAFQFDFPILIVNEEWIAVVTVFVAGGAVKDIETFFEHAAGILRVAGDAGFPDHGGLVVGALQQGGHGEIFRVGSQFKCAVATQPGVAGVQAGHERAA